MSDRYDNWRDQENSICDAWHVQIQFESAVVGSNYNALTLSKYFHCDVTHLFLPQFFVIGSRLPISDSDCSVLASWRQCSFVAFRRYAGRIWVGRSSFAIGLRDPRPWRLRSRIRRPHTSIRSAATPVLSQQPWYSERSCQSGCEFR